MKLLSISLTYRIFHLILRPLKTVSNFPIAIPPVDSITGIKLDYPEVAI
jgi:hypothetical protein